MMFRFEKIAMHVMKSEKKTNNEKNKTTKSGKNQNSQGKGNYD